MRSSGTSNYPAAEGTVWKGSKAADQLSAWQSGAYPGLDAASTTVEVLGR